MTASYQMVKEIIYKLGLPADDKAKPARQTNGRWRIISGGFALGLRAILPYAGYPERKPI